MIHLSSYLLDLLVAGVASVTASLGSLYGCLLGMEIKSFTLCAQPIHHPPLGQAKHNFLHYYMVHTTYLRCPTDENNSAQISYYVCKQKA